MNKSTTEQPTTRNVGLEDLHKMLTRQRARSVDAVVSASALHAEDTALVISDTEPLLTDDGVLSVNGTYRPTAVADEGIARKLGIPIGYLRLLRTDAPHLWDQNVNGWLRHPKIVGERFLLRGLRPEDGQGPGIARALLSDQYQIIDHLDGLMAALEGVNAAGVPHVQVEGCDLTERRMYIRIRCEAISVLAPRLLRDYRSPFTGARGADNPVVFAGFEVSNSETGCGKFTITPRLLVEVCRNGLTIPRDALETVHLGRRLEDGPIRWSLDTHTKSQDLIRSKARDAVRTFLDTDYMHKVIDRIEHDAAQPIADPARAIKVISRPLGWTEQQQKDILRHFIRGGDVTAGGVMQAVTATAQTLPDADAAHDLEAQGIRAMELAAGRA